MIRIPHTCYTKYNADLLFTVLDAAFRTLMGLEKPIVHLTDIFPYSERNKTLGPDLQVRI